MIAVLTIFVTILLLVFFVIPMGVTLLIARLRPKWPKRRLLKLASCLMPVVMMSFVILVGVELVLEGAGRVETLDDAPQRAFLGFAAFACVASAIGLALGFLAGKIALRYAQSK